MATKATNYSERLTAIRQSIAETKAEAQRVAAARIPVDEACARIAPLVDQVALRWTPMVASLAAPALPTPDSIVQAATVDPWVLTGLVAVVARDGLEAALRSALQAAYEHIAPKDCVPLGERAGRVQALTAKLFELECREERTICEAARAGVRLLRRGDEDVMAVGGWKTASVARRYNLGNLNALRARLVASRGTVVPMRQHQGGAK